VLGGAAGSPGTAPERPGIDRQATWDAAPALLTIATISALPFPAQLVTWRWAALLTVRRSSRWPR
jgi:hypothetical protein